MNRKFSGELVAVNGKKLYFLLDEPERKKILNTAINICPRGKLPSKEGYIVVQTPREYPDLLDLIGRTCQCEVRFARFCFVPKYARGADPIEGTKLHLTNIKQSFD